MSATLRRFALAGLCMGVLAGPVWAQVAAGSTPNWGLPELMASMRRVKTAAAKFTERRTLHQLSQPLVITGTLSYVAPDQVRKITLSPARESFAIDGDTLTVEGGATEQAQQLSLTSYPEIGAFIEGFRAVLAGNLDALNRFYEVQAAGTADSWQLLLQPRAPILRNHINWIRISGGGKRISLVETEEHDGDRSEMSVVDYAYDE
jgi:outer membrane lipoprotein-sorting protein